MKRIKFLLLAAIVVAMASAFTTAHKTQLSQYALVGGVYKEIGNEVEGFCNTADAVCHYEKINPDLPAEEGNLQPSTDGFGQGYEFVQTSK